MNRQLTLEPLRCTEQEAIRAWTAVHLQHCRDKNEIDDLAVRAIHWVCKEELGFNYNLVNVGCEGLWDDAAMFSMGEQLGNPHGPVLHFVADPIDGTSNTRDNLPGASSVVAFSDEDGFLQVPDIMYMRKLAVGPKAKGCISLEKSLTDNIKAVAEALNKPIRGMHVVVLNRPRNQLFIAEAQACKCHVTLINDCDIIPGIATAFANVGVDMLVGSGGAPEAILLAAALKCVGGDMCAMFVASDSNLMDDDPKMREVPHGHLTIDDMVPGGDVIFAMTGVTKTLLCNGVSYDTSTDVITTDSLVLRSATGTRRRVIAERLLSHLPGLK
jgi:fructose-1,6-bisphosphatase II